MISQIGRSWLHHLDPPSRAEDDRLNRMKLSPFWRMQQDHLRVSPIHLNHQLNVIIL